MIKSKHMRTVLFAAAMGMATTTPVMATVDLPVESYGSNIQNAKKAMVANPGEALTLARSARQLVTAQSATPKKDRLFALWLEGEALMRLNRADEAAGVIGFALFEASQAYEGDKIYADLLRSSASLKARTGNAQEALEHFLMAQTRYEELGDTRSRAIVLQNIGSLYSRAQQYGKVLEYYAQSAEVHSDDAILSLSAHNNIGNALKGLGRYDEAEKNFGDALNIAERMKSELLQARILTNLAATQQLGGESDAAQETADKALALAEGHAKDWLPFVHGVMAQIALGKGDLDEAERLITLSFEGQRLEETNALFREFHDVASQILAQRGDQELAARHMAALERIDQKAAGLAI